MKQAPCPRAVSIEKEQNQCKAIEQTQWPCLLPFLRHKAGPDSSVLTTPTPLFPGLPAPWLPAILSLVLPKHALASILTVQIVVLIHQ